MEWVVRPYDEIVTAGSLFPFLLCSIYQVRAEQRFPQSERPLPPLDANANNDISDPMNHG